MVFAQLLGFLGADLAFVIGMIQTSLVSVWDEFTVNGTWNKEGRAGDGSSSASKPMGRRMIVRAAGALAFVSLGLAIYSVWTGDKLAKEVSFLIGAVVLLLFGWQIKTIVSSIYVAENQEGFDLLVWIVVGVCFVLLFVAIALRSLLVGHQL